ncbi:MAG: hypothetical protein Q7T48_17075 [Cellvibrio sp.]|uniref:hypothetical protein n=1 Tax=Cellvibrio sp. TaxID=1965322 RepID=UPI0027262B1E|nr:hypothetical protein [Cellvibrio sp.]
MKISIEFNINKIILITSPRAGEEGIARRLEENIADVSNGGGNFNFSHARVYSGDGFFQSVEDIRQGILSGDKPIIYLDFHGAEEKGLEIGASGEFIDWETLVDVLRILNVELKNELFVLITACHGLHLIKLISIQKEAPFLCLVAPEQEIQVADLEDRVPEFFRVLFETKNVHLACKNLGENFTYLNSGELCVDPLILYYKEICNGAGKKLWREDFLSEVIKTGIPDDTKLSTLRTQIKEIIQPEIKVIFEKMINHFSMGKLSRISIDEVLAEIRKNKV